MAILGRCPVLVEVVDGVRDVDGVPRDDGVGDEGEAFALEVLIVGLRPSNFALVREEDHPAEGVERFAFVDLGLDAAAVLFVVEVAQYRDGFDDASVWHCCVDGSGA